MVCQVPSTWRHAVPRAPSAAGRRHRSCECRAGNTRSPAGRACPNDLPVILRLGIVPGRRLPRLAVFEGLIFGRGRQPAVFLVETAADLVADDAADHGADGDAARGSWNQRSPRPWRRRRRRRQSCRCPACCPARGPPSTSIEREWQGSAPVSSRPLSASNRPDGPGKRLS